MDADEVRNSVDFVLQSLYAEKPEKFGEVMFLLCTMDEHYSYLAKLTSIPKAMDTYLEKLILQSPMPSPGTAGIPSSVDEAELMLNDCRDRFGTNVVRLEKAGIISRSILDGLSRSHAGMAVGCAEAAAQFAGMTSHSLQRAFVMTAVSRVAEVVPMDQGNVFQAIFMKRLANATAVESELAQQLAKRYGDFGACCKWAGAAGAILQVGLLGYELYADIRKYWKGEIDGYQCAENLSSSFASAAAAAGGGLAAVTLCAGAAPCGLIFASLAAACVASGLTSFAVRACFQRCFDNDRDRALKRAYEVLGITRGAAPDVVRQAYLTKAKETHPDKGGNEQLFIELNSSYELIRASKF
ncbi:dnaJ [Symbiodinium sp. CCMP2592]|nr:dnaJ [Symbiodinium sp. CCMP2592]